MVSDIEERHKQDKNTVKKPKIETCSSVEIFERMTSYRKPKQTKMNVSKSVEGLDKVCDSYNDSIYANVVPNGRPATIDFDALGDGIVDCK